VLGWRRPAAPVARGFRVQRRLFVLFLLSSLLPALALLALNWRMSQRLLSYLESPGLSAAMESSLALARGALEREKGMAKAHADTLAAQFAAGRTPAATREFAWRLRDGSALGGSDSLQALLAAEIDEQPEPGSARILHDGGRTVVLAAGGSDGRLLVAMPLAPDLDAALGAVAEGSRRQRQLAGAYQEFLRSALLLTLTLLGAVLLTASLWLSYILARQIAAPLAELVRGTERIAAGDLEHRVRVKARDELAELVRAFNRMGEELATSRERRLRAERLAAWQGIARRLAHEIKNPLTPITLAMHRIERRSADPAVSESIAAVLEETANLARLADEFSLFARLPAPVPQPLELRALLTEVIALYLPAERFRARWVGWPTAVPLAADPGQLRQALANLVKNAGEAMGERGALTLRYARQAGWHRLELDDEGPGFAGDPEALFEPYVTSKAAGTGLGLAIARRIVEDHGGQLTALALPAGGARFTLALPAGEAPALAAEGGQGA